MASRDLVHSISVVNSNPGAQITTFAANAVSTSSSTTAVNTFGWESVTVVGRVHTDSLASGSILFLAQDSASTTFATALSGTPSAVVGAIAAAQLIGGAYPAAIVNPFLGTVPFGLNNSQQYVSGGYMGAVSFTGIVSTDVILGHPHHRNVAV